MEDKKIDYRRALNDEQYKVVTTGEGPCLVLAGAGSGKTRTLAFRVAYLLEQGVHPGRILLLTFTNKAAKEMLGRIDSLLDGATKGLWGGTFHGVGNKILRIYGKHLGIPSNFNILDEDDAKDLAKSAYALVTTPEDKQFPKADLVRKIISLASNLSLPLEEVIRERYSYIEEEYLPIIAEIAQHYERKKRASGALDYDDLLLEWRRLLRTVPEVRERLAEQFQYILVDEYQDTNSIQSEVIKLLAGEAGNVLVVGDDAQSIYSFRGADVSNILSFPEIFPGAKVFRLENNYRSTPEILDLANASIIFNSKKFQKELKPQKASKHKPILVGLDDGYRQAEFICRKVEDLNDGGLDYSKISVLFRSHFQSLELEMELNRRGIPYIMRGGQRFFEQAHVKDVLAYLKIVNNFQDEAAWRRALQLTDGIGPSGANKIYEAVMNHQSLKEALVADWDKSLAKKLAGGWQNIKKILNNLIILGTDNPGLLISEVTKESYATYVKNTFENYQDRLADLDRLAEFSEKYTSTDDLLADAALSESFGKKADSSDMKEKKEAVTLSTIHQAKGLEWHTVFVIGLTDGQFPATKSLERQKDLEEERRLFYVAVTRAEEGLYLTYPLYGARSGEFNRLSQFVRELPEEVYELQVNNSGHKKTGSSIFASDNGVTYVDEESEDSEVAQEFWSRIVAKRK